MTPKLTQRSHIPDVISGIPHNEAGEILTAISQAGSISADDEILELSGEANHRRKTAANLRKTVDSLPIILDRTLDQKLTGLHEQQSAHQEVITASCSGIKASVDGLGNLIKKSQLNPKSKLPYWLDWKSLVIGSMGTLLLCLPIFYLLVLPAQVNAERGKDWAIAEWLNSANGRKTRIIFQQYCQSKYPCKKLEKSQE
jgi:hypothetical protein